jgi:hypothetical protein
VEEILAGTATDASLNQRSVRVASLRAQIAALRKRAAKTGTDLQDRLPKHITAVEWLAKNWLAYRLEVETEKLLETVCIEKRINAREPAIALALAGIAYYASVEELGEPAPVSYAWTRPIESVSDKNLSALRILNDPLYKAPDPHETLQSLLKAAKGQQSRWSALLIAIGLEPSFQMPAMANPSRRFGRGPRSRRPRKGLLAHRESALCTGTRQM